MPELPQKKVGIIACSGEEMAEGTISRLAALEVLETLCPGDTVTICLPLFLAGGEGDRAFAKFYPTIAVDGCEKRCAYRGTEMYSNRPAASIVVTDLVKEQNLSRPAGKRKLDAAGMQIVEAVAQQIAGEVDQLLGKGWNRRDGAFIDSQPKEDQVATCACGSGIPVQKLQIDGKEITLIALPVILQKFIESKKEPSGVMDEMMEMVKIYNSIEPGEEASIRQTVSEIYENLWNREGAA